MHLTVTGIEWDAANEAHCAKHGLSRSDVEQVLRGEPRIAPDLKHSEVEQRFLAVGRTAAGRAAFVVFTLRGDRVRPLSARFMHAKEAAHYGA